MVVRKSRQGIAFLACENYPRCRHTLPIGTGVACPQPDCDGELVERVSKRGRRFFGCNRYPKCKFTSWSRPIAEPCPQCGSPYLVIRTDKGGNEFRVCPEKSCGHREKQESDV
jgi:DNA topoisomerase-1